MKNLVPTGEITEDWLANIRDVLVQRFCLNFWPVTLVLLKSKWLKNDHNFHQNSDINIFNYRPKETGKLSCFKLSFCAKKI